MSYPKFYDNVESIKLYDPLADILGAYENGEYEITYNEVVKSAGHSCPTVAGAYLMAEAALKELYGEKRAVRGDIEVYFKESLEEGVAGVIGNVISHITGATGKSGFKGLGGRSPRHSLMFYGAEIGSASARFISKSMNKTIDIFYDHSSIPADPKMQPLMQKVVQSTATKEEEKLFGELWQRRVELLFANKDKIIKTA